MYEFVDLGHSMAHAEVGLCRYETRTSEHIGISPAEEGWTVANDNEMYRVAALTCNVLQHCQHIIQFTTGLASSGMLLRLESYSTNFVYTAHHQGTSCSHRSQQPCMLRKHWVDL
jgi:hypothetical protein